MILSHKVVNDDRVATAMFELFGQSFGVKLPDLLFWGYLFALLILQSVVIVFFALIIYKFIAQKRGSFSSYLVGYGILIPLVFQVPFWVLDWLEIENHVLKMSVLTVPTAVTFRCLEAMHGTSPPGVEACLQNYLLYSTSVVEFQWDKRTGKRRPLVMSEFVTNTWRFISQFIMLSLLMSYLLHTNFQPFPSNVNLTNFHINFELLHAGQLLNNYLVAVLTFVTLSLRLSGAQALNHAQGYSAVPSFCNPLFRSTSPCDF